MNRPLRALRARCALPPCCAPSRAPFIFVFFFFCKVYLRGKSPLASEAKLNEAFRARLAGKVALAEDEWSDVLRYMHSHAGSGRCGRRCGCR